jgi:hypothetical protein
MTVADFQPHPPLPGCWESAGLLFCAEDILCRPNVIQGADRRPMLEQWLLIFQRMNQPQICEWIGGLLVEEFADDLKAHRLLVRILEANGKSEAAHRAAADGAETLIALAKQSAQYNAIDRAVELLREAVSLDPSARARILADPLLEVVSEKFRTKEKE